MSQYAHALLKFGAYRTRGPWMASKEEKEAYCPALAGRAAGPALGGRAAGRPICGSAAGQ